MTTLAPASPGRFSALLSNYLRPQGGRVVLLAVLLLSGIGLELIGPTILRDFIDSAAAASPLSVLTRIALLYLGVALLQQGFAVAEAYVAQNVGLTATNRLRSELALHCLGLDLSFHNNRTPGELIERVDGDVATLGNFFSRFAIHLAGNALLLVGVLVLLFRIDWRVGLALTIFSIVSLVLVNSLRHVAVPYWDAARQATAALFGFLEERLSGTEDIRANGASAYSMRLLHERARDLLIQRRRADIVGVSTGTVTIVLLMVGIAVALGLSALLFRDGAISIGTVYLIFNYTQLLTRPIDEITRQFQDLQQAGASAARIEELFSFSSTIEDGPGAAFPDGALAVEFEDVSFGYEDEGPVLQGLSFELEPGSVLGLLGRTGSGKTTVTRLLFRLYDPTRGTIRLGGVELRAARMAALRTRIGMVTQEINLFHATVRDNLTLWDRTILDEKVLEVLHQLGLGTWYAELPDGLDTRLPPGGGGISAGEAQLLAFARVFLKDPGLVILDEASSRLDPATEARVEQAIDLLLRDRTAIIIAHRLTTVQRADAIMILERGTRVEYGKREELANDPGSRFAHLLRTGLDEVLA